MSLQDSPLGKQTHYIAEYAPELLHSIARTENRKELGIEAGSLPFWGMDIWNGYELSWLNGKGKPEVALAEFRIPCDTPNIIESKSFKLYLNSLNQTRFGSWDELQATLARDLARALGVDSLEVKLAPVTEPLRIQIPDNALCVDELDIEVDCYHPQAAFLTANPQCQAAETLVSHLLKSNCPVTGQPDWASLIVSYEGGQLSREGLLRYVISFREHQDFHEHCVERIFCDIMERCRPSRLSVYARYTRRGGLDINPLRSSHPMDIENLRLIRQ